MDSLLGGTVHFVVLFLISAIVKKILEDSISRLKAIKVEVLADSTFKSMADVVLGPSNISGKSPRYMSFSVFDEFGFVEPLELKDHVDLWNLSKAAYLSTVLKASTSDISNGFFRWWIFTVLPFLEKFMPAFLLLALIEYLLFNETGLFVVIVFFLVALLLFSILLCLIRLSFLMKVKANMELSKNFEKDIQNNIHKALLIIHFSPFYRCLGLFWRLVNVLKWLFRE